MNSFSIKGIFAIFLSPIIYFLGGWDKGIEILIFIVATDYATGIIKAIINKNLSSEIGFRGIFKKICIFIMVMVAVQIDKMIGQKDTVRQLVCLFYIANESLSILENIAGAGLPLPNFLTKLLAQIKDSADKGEMKQ